jgi:hypothetical protein
MNVLPKELSHSRVYPYLPLLASFAHDLKKAAGDIGYP